MTPGPVVDQLADHAREGPAGRRLGISRRNRHECCPWGNEEMRQQTRRRGRAMEQVHEHQ